MSADTDMLERLRSLASALGAGGLDETDPAKLLARVEWGVDHIQQVEAARSAQVVEELSKQPRTTWGEVKKAILARAPLDASGSPPERTEEPLSFAWTPGAGAYKHYPPYVNLTGNRLTVRGREDLTGEHPMMGPTVAIELPSEALDELRAALQSSGYAEMERENARLRTQIEVAAVIFDEYGRLHRKKGTAEGDLKAERNEQYAAEMRTALRGDQEQGEG